jgi:lipopolysaccharide biosynthesis glycosyltransferase
MEILCTCDEKFVPHAATMLCSFLEHNRASSRIHLFHSTDASLELAKLERFVLSYNSKIGFYEMTNEAFKDFDIYDSTAYFYRLVAPRILDPKINKILYLDSDLIVRRSLADLWNTTLNNYALAAVQDVKWDPFNEEFSRLFSIELALNTKYFNSGVMLINLEYWRQNDVAERTIAFVKNHPEKIKLPDQDALNAVLAGQWLNLPAVWNAQHQHISGLSSVEDAAIVHYCGDIKPWDWSWYDVQHPYKYEYHRYRSKTPWRRYRLGEFRPGWSWLWRVYRLLWRIGKRLLPVKVRARLRSRISGAWAPSQD